MPNNLIPIVHYVMLEQMVKKKDYQPETPRLGTASSPSHDQWGNPGYTVLRALSAEEFSTFDSAVQELGQLHAARQVVQILLRNAAEFDEALEQIAAQHRDKPLEAWAFVSEFSILLNQKLLNYLSVMRTFLDHAETRLKRRYGKSSPEVKELADATRREYDSNFAYRFTYHLRNYTQHCGMPLGRIQSISSLSDVNPPSHQLDLFFDRDELLRNYKEWKSVKSELEKQPECFPLRDYIEESKNSILRIDGTLTARAKVRVQTALAFLEGLKAEVAGGTGTACVYTRLNMEGNPLKKSMEYTMFPTATMEAAHQT